MCDGVGLSLEEAANDLELVNVERSLNMGILRRRVRGTRFLWGEERRGSETADAALPLYLPRREAAAGDDPEVLHCLNGRTRQNLGHTKRMRLWSPFVFLSCPPDRM